MLRDSSLHPLQKIRLSTGQSRSSCQFVVLVVTSDAFHVHSLTFPSANNGDLHTWQTGRRFPVSSQAKQNVVRLLFYSSVSSHLTSWILQRATWWCSIWNMKLSLLLNDNVNQGHPVFTVYGIINERETKPLKPRTQQFIFDLHLFN